MLFPIIDCVGGQSPAPVDMLNMQKVLQQNPLCTILRQFTIFSFNTKT